ncbi:MAG: CYTH domain-containing protein [Christensenellaceae bacterium]|jgi:uncharacterized protein YjbK|nr:CYTH domain-containing protein [Christensenellaceae bacterium]
MPEAERELKTMLCEAEFFALCRRLTALFGEPAAYGQTNHYFDTEDFLLLGRGDSLRARQKGGALRAEYKLFAGMERGARDSLEFSWPLGELPEEIILNRGALGLPQGVFPGPYRLLGALHTFRRDFAAKGLLLSLDESHYLGQTDFELEIESPSADAALTLLGTLGIPYLPPNAGKYGRFLAALRAARGSGAR